jgi:cell division protein FtsB
MCTWSPQPGPARQPPRRRPSPPQADSHSSWLTSRGQDIVAALGSLAQQVSQLQADNDRLREDNDRLREDNDRLRGELERRRTLMRQIAKAITRQASQLLGDPET